MTPNSEQIKAILQMLLGAGGPLAALIMSYGVPADKLSLWTNLIVAVVPPLAAGIWAAIDNKRANTVRAASNVPGVKVQVATGPTSVAPVAVQALTTDQSAPNVAAQQKAA